MCACGARRCHCNVSKLRGVRLGHDRAIGIGDRPAVGRDHQEAAAHEPATGGETDDPQRALQHVARWTRRTREAAVGLAAMHQQRAQDDRVAGARCRIVGRERGEGGKLGEESAIPGPDARVIRGDERHEVRQAAAHPVQLECPADQRWPRNAVARQDCRRLDHTRIVAVGEHNSRVEGAGALPQAINDIRRYRQGAH